MNIGFCTYASLIATRESHRNSYMSLELILFFSYDPRLANSYRIHFYKKKSYKSNTSEMKKSIGS
jgi:hypothetical protein